MTTLAQRSFAGGEIAPALYARTDQTKYATGLRTCRNFIVRKEGGVSNRPGSEFITAVKDSSAPVRLIKFVFNADQTYVLEFGDEYLRVTREGAPIMDGGDPYEIATPYQVADVSGLQVTQSGDVITIVHPSYATRELARTAHDAWTLTGVTFAPETVAPSGVATSGGSPGPGYRFWAVTAIDDETGEESLMSANHRTNNDEPSVGTPTTVTWTAVPGAVRYNVFRSFLTLAWSLSESSFGFIGSSSTNLFVDEGPDPDYGIQPPVPRDPFDATGKYPAAVGYYQQRRILGGSDTEPEKAHASRTANFYNFTVSSPTQDDDAVTFTLAGKQVNRIRHFVDLEKLMILTSGGIYSVEGDGDGIVTPGQVNLRRRSSTGAATLTPIVIGENRLLFVQARGTLVRDFKADAVSGYSGADLSIFSAHLFEGHTLVDWDYQETPNSIVWAVRSDGVLLGLTYIPEHDIWGWHRHDTDGFVENVCVVPEGAEDRVYLVVRRTIDGETVRYVERLASRFVADIREACFLDSCLVFDGRNTDDSRTLTLSGGTDWTVDDTLTCTASASAFVAGDVGNGIHLTDGDGETVRFRIEEYTSATVVTVRPERTVPASLRATPRSTWSRAVDQIAGLDHLEGKTVGVLADGFVVASPNNASYDPITVDDGTVTLDRPYAVVRVGLPYIADLETLDIDTPSGPSVKGKAILIKEVAVTVEASRGVFAGQRPPMGDDPLENLNEVKVREDEDYDEPVALATDTLSVGLESTWGQTGRVFLRQVDPLPLTVLAILPSGVVPASA